MPNDSRKLIELSRQIYEGAADKIWKDTQIRRRAGVLTPFEERRIRSKVYQPLLQRSLELSLLESTRFGAELSPAIAAVETATSRLEEGLDMALSVGKGFQFGLGLLASGALLIRFLSEPSFENGSALAEALDKSVSFID